MATKQELDQIVDDLSRQVDEAATETAAALEKIERVHEHLRMRAAQFLRKEIDGHHLANSILLHLGKPR